MVPQIRFDTFFGREKENLVFPIALANLILHGIDQPNLWRGNTLTGKQTYDGLFEQAPATFDVILTNPPLGGKADKHKITTVEEAIKTKEKAVREVQAKASDIDAVVYDLKAVNPNAKAVVDTRTVQEIIDNINRQGEIVAQAMTSLRGMIIAE